MSGFVSIFYFLITFTFSAVIFVLWARFALRFFHVSSLHPAAQVIYQITDPMTLPLNRLFLMFNLKTRRYDIPTLLTIFIVEFIKFTLIGLLAFGFALPLLQVTLYALADLIIEPCDLMFYVIILRVIISWVKPDWQHPIHFLCYTISEPLLKFIRRWIPSFAGLDFSPLFAIMLLKTISLTVAAILPNAI